MKLNLILSALLVSASICFAADEPKKPATGGDKPKMTPEEAFKKMDKNGDGKLSKEEFLGKREGEAKTKGEAAFAAKDKDKDGFLSKEEFMAAPAKKKAK